MATPTNQPQEKKDNEFGLPKVEFKPIAARGKQWFKITATIVGIVLGIGVGVVYWFFYREPTVDPSEKMYAMLKEQKGAALAPDTYPLDEGAQVDEPAVEQEREETKLAEELPASIEAAAEKAKQPNASPAAQSPKGSITNIHKAQGYYYIVLGSYIDRDLASDYARILAKKGIAVTLIAPPLGQHYFRVALKQGNVLRDAHRKAEALKVLYGKEIWVMKY